MGSAPLSVDSTAFKFSGTTHADVVAAFPRYQKLMFPHPVPKSTGEAAAGLSGCTITVKNTTQLLQLETDESYTLKVASGGCTISSETYVGALRALETLSQLIMFNFDTQTYSIASAPVEIDDQPRFHHREVLVDTSRHFEPVETLKSLIDSLTYGKINVIHWHLVDQQSFPFDSKSRPLLSQKGAYSPQERYTELDVAEVVEFGRARGVRMMVEIDGPGHAAIWCKGYPEICPSGAPDGKPSCTEPLNPATNATYELLDDLMQDLTGGVRGTGLFPDNVVHLGGDEVNTACYESTPSIAKWLKQKGLTADGGYEDFVKKYQAIAHSKGRDVAGWEEIWHHFGAPAPLTVPLAVTRTNQVCGVTLAACGSQARSWTRARSSTSGSAARPPCQTSPPTATAVSGRRTASGPWTASPRPGRRCTCRSHARASRRRTSTW